MCSSHNFHLAPPVKKVDGLLAVLIDIQQLKVHTVFDMSTRKAHVEAVMHFISGPEYGNPIFDLRQNILKVHLNNELLSLNKVQHHDFDGGSDAELRILEKNIPPTTDNILTLSYDLY